MFGLASRVSAVCPACGVLQTPTANRDTTRSVDVLKIPEGWERWRGKRNEYVVSRSLVDLAVVLMHDLHWKQYGRSSCTKMARQQVSRSHATAVFVADI